MFIKQKIFEKLLNEAYKGAGVYIGCTENDLKERVYCIGTSNWAIWVDTLELTKEAKGAIIKLCGDLPTYGHAFEAMKDYNNAERLHTEYRDILKKYITCSEKLRKTRLFAWNHSSAVRIFQGSSGKVYPIRCEFVDLIDKKAVDSDAGELEPEGPVITPDGSHVFWRNDTCTVVVCPQEFSENDKTFWDEISKLTVI